MQLVNNSTIQSRPDELIAPQPNGCSCSNCGWSGPISECETEMESEAREYPNYLVHLCPKCGDGGCIDDYWYASELTAKRTPVIVPGTRLFSSRHKREIIVDIVYSKSLVGRSLRKDGTPSLVEVIVAKKEVVAQRLSLLDEC